MALLMENSPTLHSVMLNYVLDALKAHEGNKTLTARALGVSVRALRNWITKYDELKDYRNPRTK